MSTITSTREAGTVTVARTLTQHAASPFDHVVDVDECGAPILAEGSPIVCENQA